MEGFEPSSSGLKVQHSDQTELHAQIFPLEFESRTDGLQPPVLPIKLWEEKDGKISIRDTSSANLN